MAVLFCICMMTILLPITAFAQDITGLGYFFNPVTAH